MGEWLLSTTTYLLILGWQGWEVWLWIASKKFGREVNSWLAAN